MNGNHEWRGGRGPSKPRQICGACGHFIPACVCKGGPEVSTTTDAVACPWCGKPMRDLWEAGPVGESEYDDAPVECGSCDKPFLLSRSITVTHTARRPR